MALSDDLRKRVLEAVVLGGVVNRRRKVTPDWSAPLGVDRLGSRN